MQPLTARLRKWWHAVRKHPYADVTALVFFLILGGGGFRLWVRPTVAVTVDGRHRKLHTQARTVAEALVAGHIVLGAQDICIPSPDTPIRDRTTVVHITRVTQTVESVVQRHPPKISQRVQLKSNLRPVLVERGVIVVDSQTVRSTYYDGVLSGQTVLKRKVLRKPIFTLTLFNAVTGQPEKIYDLAKAKKMVMRATGYYVGEKYVPSDTTYLGYKLQRGLVAVDPTVIPLRTRLYVKGYGYAYAADTGSRIKGNRIDLAVKGYAEEQSFNRQGMTVYVLEKANSW
jgi:3D (Asp-Asp-Asp) domain-containing protein